MFDRHVNVWPAQRPTKSWNCLSNQRSSDKPLNRIALRFGEHPDNHYYGTNGYL